MNTTTQVAQQSHAKLRLTRRGRIVIATFALLLAMTALALGAMFSASTAEASVENLDSSAFTYVVAQPGDSLWTLAARVAPDADTRDVIYEIQRLNNIPTSDIQVGQELAIPLKYTE